MRDLHCHIVPGVDDGAPDLAASLAMLEAAKGAGITSIVCTRTYAIHISIIERCEKRSSCCEHMPTGFL